ncbi:MAG TPA: ATP-binding protein [Terriglobia bacterium]|nr:ATP-binding protein [Terriglobia bacterium]
MSTHYQRGRHQPGLDATQRALMNILEDLTSEQGSFEAAQRALLNILEDSEAEKLHLQGAQRAVLNILEDFDGERCKVEVINRNLQAEIEERQKAEGRIKELNQELEGRVIERTAELAASNRELEAFAYSVSHDLRAPLRHMDGFLTLLAKHSSGRLDAGGLRYLDKVATASRTLGILIDDLLQFSRMGRNEIRKAAVDLDRLLEQIRQEFELENKDRRVNWVIGPLPEVVADPAMLRLVMTNLISNAFKFTRPRGEARIEIGSTGDAGDEAVIFVKDNGVGFDPQYAAKLFKVFQRLHSSDEFEGTGIGLANVRRIVERHGGRVWAEGAVGAGASFYFSLPGRNFQEATNHEERT